MHPRCNLIHPGCNPVSPRLQPYVSAGAHICVNHGVSADLDALRTDTNPTTPTLTVTLTLTLTLALTPALTLALTRRCAQTTGRWRTCSPTRRSTSPRPATPCAPAATPRAQPAISRAQAPTLRAQTATLGAQPAALCMYYTTQVRARAAAHGRADVGRARARRGALRDLRAAGVSE